MNKIVTYALSLANLAGLAYLFNYGLPTGVEWLLWFWNGMLVAAWWGLALVSDKVVADEGFRKLAANYRPGEIWLDYGLRACRVVLIAANGWLFMAGVAAVAFFLLYSFTDRAAGICREVRA